MNRTRRPGRGLSLLEIIIAMQITALLLALLCRVLPLARRQVRDTNHKLGNAIAAQNVLEEYLVVPLDQWPYEPVQRDGYQALLSVETWNQDSSMKLVTVTLITGQQESYRLDTLVVAP
jgi:type II secretory pathway pseudopilin PulG